MENLKTAIKAVNISLCLILIILAIGFIFIATPIFGNKALIVRTNSMQPTLPAGSLVVVKPRQPILSPQPKLAIPKHKNGDVISFKSMKNSKIITTHRIVNTVVKDGKIFYQTKGDANNSADQNLVLETNIIGNSVILIPYIGRLIGFAKSGAGFGMLIILPAIFVIVLEGLNIFKEIRKQKVFAQSQTLSVSGLAGFKVIIPFITALLVFHNSFAFFTDGESGNNNLFSAAESFGPPIANNLVINEVMFDPPNTNACGSENDAEWVEIYNPTSSPINLDTWLVGDGNFTDDLPNVLLPAGGFAVVSDCTQSSFTSIWALPGGTVYIDLSGAIGNGLNNGGEHMRLFNGATLVDDMSYGSNTDAFTPSVPAPVADHSIERDPDGVDTDTAPDFVDRTTPTPGI